jgi:predicted AAA+ superfamily ATPase
MITRTLNYPESNSFFLFGPRGVGKTTSLDRYYSKKDTLFIDLLDPDTFDNFILDKSNFKSLIDSDENKVKRVVIDEIQKIPELLDIIHSRIQKDKRLFVLTGSSSRRLKQKGTNLLAGRAWIYNLYPFSSTELANEFELKKFLERGGLPDAYFAKDMESTREYLSAYSGTYLQKEIQEERWVRNIAPFRKFLSIASQMNGKILNKLSIARDVGVNDNTVANYFEILEDTLLGFFLPAFHSSVRKAQILSPKFYFIDPGIKRALDRTIFTGLEPQTSAWGDAFEHFIILEFVKNISYKRLGWEISYFKSKDGVEIDLIVDRPGSNKLLIEIKSKDNINELDAKALESLGKDLDPKADRWIISSDKIDKKIGGTQALHWIKALKELF